MQIKIFPGSRQCWVHVVLKKEKKKKSQTINLLKSPGRSHDCDIMSGTRALFVFSYLGYSKDLQYFVNVRHNLAAVDALLQRWWTTLDSELTKFGFSMAWSTALKIMVFGLLDLQGCYNPNKIWTIWFLYYDQPHLSLLHDRCFWLRMQW